MRQHWEELVYVAPSANFVFVLQPPELPNAGGHFDSGKLEQPLQRRVRETTGLIQMRNNAHKIVEAFVQDNPRLSIVEPETLFKNGSTILFRDSQTMYYYDNKHLSVVRAIRCVNVFESAIQQQLVEKHNVESGDTIISGLNT